MECAVTEFPLPPIVVGIDESAPSDSAILWAAAEATRRRVPLVAAHTTSPETNSALSGAREVIASRWPTIDGYDVAVDGPILPALIDLSPFAEMIVIGRRSHRRLAGILGASLGNAIARAALCPVTVVEQDSLGASDGPVVVGLQGGSASLDALEFAFEQARARRTQIRAVRAWGDLHWREPASGAAPGRDSRSAIERDVAGRALEDYRSRFPDVQVEIIVVEATPDWALVHAAQAAALLVVGSSSRVGARGDCLDSVAGWALHHSPCPVVVVGHHPNVLTQATRWSR